MKILTFLLAIMLLALSTYGLINENAEAVSLYIPIVAGLMLITLAITEYPKQKATALAYFLLSAILLTLGVYSL